MVLAALLLVQTAWASPVQSMEALARALDTDYEHLLTSDRLAPGDAISDWVALITGRCGGDGTAYLQGMEDYVTRCYAENGGLSDSRATEWHRISLTILALGGDPTAFAKGRDGRPINLVAEGTYQWNVQDSLGFQGLNGWLYALLTLDAKCYTVPQDAKYSRAAILENILTYQAEDGSFNLDQGGGSVDMTAMALQALAPYRHSTVAYPLPSGGERTVDEAVTAALDWLHDRLAKDGTYKNSCSTAQVVLALCDLGIDPRHFSHGGSSIRDGLLSYETKDGLFRYLAEDETYDMMSTEQVVLALSAMQRLDDEQRRIFDFRDEMAPAVRKEIDTLNKDLAALSPQELDTKVDALYERYLSIPADERSYVSGACTLLDAVKRSGGAIKEDDPTTAYDLTAPTQAHGGHSDMWIGAAAAGAVVIAAVVLVIRKKGKKSHEHI